MIRRRSDGHAPSGTKEEKVLTPYSQIKEEIKVIGEKVRDVQ